MKTIFLMMDSLNRHYLNAYGSNKIQTPNMDRILDRAVTFDSHYVGSLPCMPARREMMTGRLNFLEAPWGPIEPWDICLTDELRKQKKTYTHMITDHYHYFHSGGEAYHTLFDTWEFERGQEADVWHPLVNAPEIPDYKGKNSRPYWVNKEFYDEENDEEYPSPRCFMRGMEFLENNHEADNWHLHLEVFDPHEPFVCPKKYRDMYEDDWEAPFHFDWPPYASVTEGDEAVKHIRKSYAGVVTMTDVWLGKFIDKMDELNMWEDTVLVLSTDHGHLLGEHGYWAKNYMFDYQELVHIPLMVCTPETAFSHKRIKSLTATIDLMPTILDLHGAEIPSSVQGKSILPLLEEDKAFREAVLYGYFAKGVNMFDGTHTYCRQATPGATVHHHTLMPRGFNDFIPDKDLKNAEHGCFLKYTDIPQLRIPMKSYRHQDAPNYNLIYNVITDENQESPIFDEKLENELADKMKVLLEEYQAPECQFTRLGL